MATSLLAALGMYAMWGAILPVYWRSVHGMPPLETLAHRVLWGAVFVGCAVGPRGIKAALADLRHDRRRQILVALGAALIGSNWLVYIWGVRAGRMMEASLGYYIGPLFSMCLGSLILGERLRSLQRLSVALAALGVAYLVGQRQVMPWFGLALAASFSAYSLVRKLSRLRGMQGFIVETVVLSPGALAYLIALNLRGEAQFLLAPKMTQALLMGSGVLGSLPIILFGVAAQGLRLTTLGLLQYLAPTLGLAMAVMVFGEPMTPTHWVTFSCIWAGIALWAWDSLTHASAQK